MIISKIVSAIIMVLLCSVIPFIWWIITARKKENFFKWIGCYAPKLKMKLWGLAIFLVIYYFVWSFDITIFMDQASMESAQNSGNLAANAYTGLGFAAVLPALIESFLVNSLGEEIFFRGFVCKRLQSKFGKNAGLILQACCFGIMHNILYLLGGMDVSLQFHLAVFGFTGGGALLLGYINEKIYNGSIIPSVILHGLGNFIANIQTAF